MALRMESTDGHPVLLWMHLQTEDTSIVRANTSLPMNSPKPSLTSSTLELTMYEGPIASSWLVSLLIPSVQIVIVVWPTFAAHGRPTHIDLDYFNVSLWKEVSRMTKFNTLLTFPQRRPETIVTLGKTWISTSPLRLPRELLQRWPDSHSRRFRRTSSSST